MAIRCAELGIPAAIGCGDQPIDRIKKSKYCIIDCLKEELFPDRMSKWKLEYRVELIKKKAMRN